MVVHAAALAHPASKECLNAGEAIKDLKGTCWIDNGKVLTSVQTLETPQGTLTMTMVFDRVAPRSADSGPTSS